MALSHKQHYVKTFFWKLVWKDFRIVRNWWFFSDYVNKLIEVQYSKMLSSISQKFWAQTEQKLSKNWAKIEQKLSKNLVKTGQKLSKKQKLSKNVAKLGKN